MIFDEIHYIQDPERGVVWEETILLLPHNVQLLFLSATLPNAVQFASWITKTRKTMCHVVHSNYRPVPLTHYLFPEGGSGLYLLSDSNVFFNCIYIILIFLGKL